MWLRVSAIIFQLFKLIMLEKCVLTILELNWNQLLGHIWEDKIDHLSSYAHVVHTPAKQVISRRRKNENVFKMSKDEKCTCKACKSTVFSCQICKFVGFLLPSSSWLLKLPKIYSRPINVKEDDKMSLPPPQKIENRYVSVAGAKRGKTFDFSLVSDRLKA